MRVTEKRETNLLSGRPGRAKTRDRYSYPAAGGCPTVFGTESVRDDVSVRDMMSVRHAVSVRHNPW